MGWIYEIDVGKIFTSSPVYSSLPTSLKRKRKMPIYMMLKRY